MQACVIMHNMIIENEHGKNEEYGIYDLMGHPVQLRRGACGEHVEFYLQA
jgi:hypothetical protein